MRERWCGERRFHTKTGESLHFESRAKRKKKSKYSSSSLECLNAIPHTKTTKKAVFTHFHLVSLSLFMKFRQLLCLLRDNILASRTQRKKKHTTTREKHAIWRISRLSVRVGALASTTRTSPVSPLPSPSSPPLPHLHRTPSAPQTFAPMPG